VGFWTYTTKVDDLVVTDSGGRPVRRTSRGAYLLAERTLLREEGSPVRHLAGFFRLSFNDADSTPIQYAINLGLRLRAPFREREDDIVGIAYSHAHLGDKYRDAERLAGNATTSAEEALEITYRFQISDAVAVQPVFQHIRHPGGDPALAAAKIVGARLELSF
jgi:porin